MSYDANSIKSLSFLEGVRSRIQMYLGSADNEGIYQAFKEIINNSTDEALCGYGKKIIIDINEKENYIAVTDFGRGVPFLIKENGENVLVDIYTKAHTGGKFDDNSYKNASGLNGIGGSCVCLSSEKFEVESHRDGKYATAYFEKGILKNYHEGITKQPNGTYVRFKPDQEVFKDEKIQFSYERICKEIKDISYLYNGIEFILNNENTKEKQIYCAKRGIVDFIKDNLPTPIGKEIITYSVEDETDKLEIAFQWGSKKEESYVFVNGLRCPEGGSPIVGAKTAITRTFNSLTKSSFSGDLIRENLFYVINCKVANPSYSNQTKSKINNSNLRTLASNAFSEALKQMKMRYSNDFELVFKMLSKCAKAEVAAERARQAILNHEKEQRANEKKKLLNIDKLRDARQLGQNSILLCVEGNSAGGSMSIGRDPNKYGILMFRGKAKNLLKSTIEEGLENEEVKLLLQAIGLTYGKIYKSEKLRYGKIALAVDGDFDGSHISLLLMSMLQVLFPEIIKENRLFWLRAPICKVETKKQTYYYYNEKEFKNHPQGNITFFKGLGQMSDEDLKNSMFNEQWQHLEPIEYSDKGINTLLELMSEDVEPRKDFVFNNIDFSNFEVE